MHATTRNAIRLGVITAASGGLLLAAAGAAQAHMGVELHGGTPTAGSSSSIFFRPGHGCDGDATNAITITIPDGVTGAKAQPKAGWKLTRTATTVTWSRGSLPDDQFDEFGLRVTWPKFTAGEQSAKYYFKAVQNCNAELKVARDGATATITGFLPHEAGEKVLFFVDGTQLTAHETVVGADGTVSVVTKSSKVPAGAVVTAKAGDRLVGTSNAGVEAWVEIPEAGSTATLAAPAPSVTVVAATAPAGH